MLKSSEFGSVHKKARPHLCTKQHYTFVRDPPLIKRTQTLCTRLDKGPSPAVSADAGFKPALVVHRFDPVHKRGGTQNRKGGGRRPVKQYETDIRFGPASAVSYQKHHFAHQKCHSGLLPESKRINQEK
jgi:hypothetical protein